MEERAGRDAPRGHHDQSGNWLAVNLGQVYLGARPNECRQANAGGCAQDQSLLHEVHSAPLIRIVVDRVDGCQLASWAAALSI